MLQTQSREHAGGSRGGNEVRSVCVWERECVCGRGRMCGGEGECVRVGERECVWERECECV